MAHTVKKSLTSLLRDQFPSATRSRGHDYAQYGAVKVFSGSPTCVDAVVSGGELYQVSIRFDVNRDALECSCTCPAFEHESVCKHLWAVIEVADQKGSLSALLDSSPKGVKDASGRRRMDEIDDDNDADDQAIASRGEMDQLKQIFNDILGPAAAIFGEGSPIPIGNYSKPPAKPKPAKRPAPPAVPAWKKTLSDMAERKHARAIAGSFWNEGRQALYILDLSHLAYAAGPSIELAMQDRKTNGQWSKPRRQRISVREIRRAPDPRDRNALEAIYSQRPSNCYSRYANDWDELSWPMPLSLSSLPYLLPLICKTQRCWVRMTSAPDAQLIRLNWDDGEPWRLMLEVEELTPGGDYGVRSIFRRGSQTLPLDKPDILLDGGIMIVGDTASRFEDGGDFDWIEKFRKDRDIRVPRADGRELARMLHLMPGSVPIHLPTDLHIEEQQGVPKPLLRLRQSRSRSMVRAADSMEAALEFDYGIKTVKPANPHPVLLSDDSQLLVRRDRAAEHDAYSLLRSFTFKDLPLADESDGFHLEVRTKKMPAALTHLIAAGWRVEAEGVPYRSAGSVNLKVTSGIDWFDLEGQAHFDDQMVELPRLLAALRRGENTIVLGDGTIGMLPQEWLKKYGTLAALGTEKDDHVRFTSAQVGLLDALLAAMPEATCDAVFEQARQRLRQFDGIHAADAPQGFGGELRPYQREGLGWLHFLRQFRFGGCLADDMGLGKTIQVLAMLEARRQEKEAARLEFQQKNEANRDAAASGQAPPPRPSLVVLPRSLVFNWRNEAAKFAPSLRVLDHTGIDRICRSEGDHTAALSDFDLILTTYGTIRADAAKLKDVKFDYVILDEAQAIKNASTACAKAVRLLAGEHRLVMTGTPVENRLADLWSIFEFLNPGMLGSASVFKLIGGAENAQGDEARRILARALRPFILRRKKDQVARDLPARVEQTIYCELEPKQRKLYNELREHYRQSLLSKIDTEGMGKSKMHVLEALLRLRQAACHPGLIDKRMDGEPSVKIDALLPQLQELVDEGHKVLVFSQFTSLLAILRKRLDGEGITYEYLDGGTKDRQARVDRFQTDPACPLFLISLKAGGVGLNLTAAEHVFLLDPWWNPAVEAQAIDRAHRIGQKRQVFAFRLIARDTVEEKVLELQNSKRELADAIISQDNSLITKLGRAELEMLLS